MEPQRGAPRYAGFWRRLWAHLIDTAILFAAGWVAEFLIFGAMYLVYAWIVRSHGAEPKAKDDAFDPFFTQGVGALIDLALITPYYVWGQYRYGTTLGKRLFRIYVVNEADGAPLRLGQSFLRFVGYLVSYLPVGCGFLMVAFQPQKRALHDLIAGTVSVIKEK